MDVNPYSPPVEVEESPATGLPKLDAGLGWSIVRWLVICPICAGPTLFVACNIFHQLDQLAAIFCASAMIVAAFVYVERVHCLAWQERLLHLRTALRVGFIARMVISVLFPIGLMLDMV